MTELHGSTYNLTRWLFLRSIGLVYLIAFASAGVQILGLIGSRGILPVGDMLKHVAMFLGPERYWLVPTLAWINSTDSFLHFLCWGGTIFALLAVLGITTGPALALCWLLYLSLVTAGGDFMSFQWDALLLETGFLAMLFAPWQILSPPWKGPPALMRRSPPSRLLLWLLRWLLFRLMFMSGCVKLLSGDDRWRDLSAMAYHYWTQPLPTPPAWYASQLPLWFQKVSTVGVFVIELAIPFLIFAPRRARILGAGILIGFQLLIAFTGNYTFFNLLTIALCLLLLDDHFLRRVIPGFLRQQIADATSAYEGPTWRRYALRVVAAIVVFASALELAESLAPVRAVGGLAGIVNAVVSPFHIVNGYGLFAVMTTSRPEIIVEGSRDGENWLAYEFPYKPGDPARPFPWAAPYQPRLDWQMWFAALGSYRNNPWFVQFMRRLLEGSPDVLALIEKNPFAGAPPRFIRARVVDYYCTTWPERQSTGNWWRTVPHGEYFPMVSLQRF